MDWLYGSVCVNIFSAGVLIFICLALCPPIHKAPSSRIRICICSCRCSCICIHSIHRSIYLFIYQSQRSPNYEKMKALFVGQRPSMWAHPPIRSIHRKQHLGGSIGGPTDRWFGGAAGSLVGADPPTVPLVNGSYLISY